MVKLHLVLTVLRDYEFDSKKGYIKDTETYIQTKCLDYGIYEMSDEITKLILKAIYL